MAVRRVTRFADSRITSNAQFGCRGENDLKRAAPSEAARGIVAFGALSEIEVPLKLGPTLSESSRWFLQHASDGIHILDSEGNLVEASDSFCQMLGYTKAELMGVNVAQWDAKIPAAELAGFVAGLFEHPAIQTFETRHRRKDGTVFDVEVTGCPTMLDGHWVLYEASRDITKRRRVGETLRESMETLKEAQTIGSVGSYVTDILAGAWTSSDVMDGIFGIGMNYDRTVAGWAALIHPDDRAMMAAYFQDEVIGEGKPFNKEYRIVRQTDMAERWVHGVGRLEFDAQGRPVKMRGVIRDITESKLAALQLSESEERYRATFEQAPIGIVHTALDGGFLRFNSRFAEIIGYPIEEVHGLTFKQITAPEDMGKTIEALERVSSRTSETVSLEKRIIRKDGAVVWGKLSISAQRDSEGRVLHFISMIEDIDARKQTEELLTGALEALRLSEEHYRTVFQMSLDAITISRLSDGRYIDANKAFLDLIGIEPEEIVERTSTDLGIWADLETRPKILEMLSQNKEFRDFRTQFVKKTGEKIWVLISAADEFAVLLEDLSEIAEDAAAQAEHIAERVLAAIGQAYLLDEHECHCAASIGINVFGKDPESPEEVLQRAELAMYQAKKAGRNTMRFFAPDLQAAVNARAALEEGLRKGIKAEQFVLYYQPQVVGGRLIGAEALIRWKHPRRGLLGPCEFIPLAEETGMILPLGDWVLEAACEQISKWADRKEMASVVVAVNISARQFRHPEFVDGVMAVLKRTGANPQALKLELTESMLVDNIEEVIDKMTVLKSHGLRFALDDFGTGYSSLSYLKRLPLDQLKIDRAFVRDILLDAASGAIAQTLISLGRAMGLSVIAEGVETEEQREFLAGLGCHTFQGFLFGRPAPLQEFEHLWSGARNPVRKP
jgi:PAS domain S-box-containing protein